MFQNVVITGRLGADPEMRYLENGTAVCNFSVAVNNRRGETLWFRVSAWQKTAENVNQYMSKGRIVTVSGELLADDKTGGPRLFTRRDGSSGASFELNANSVAFVGGSSEDADQSGQSDSGPGGKKEEDEIPF